MPCLLRLVEALSEAKFLKKYMRMVEDMQPFIMIVLVGIGHRHHGAVILTQTVRRLRVGAILRIVAFSVSRRPDVQYSNFRETLIHHRSNNDANDAAIHRKGNITTVDNGTPFVIQHFLITSGFFTAETILFDQGNITASVASTNISQCALSGL